MKTKMTRMMMIKRKRTVQTMKRTLVEKLMRHSEPRYKPLLAQPWLTWITRLVETDFSVNSGFRSGSSLVVDLFCKLKMREKRP